MLDVRKYSIKHRVVEFWNTLPEMVIECKISMGSDAFYPCNVVGSFLKKEASGS